MARQVPRVETNSMRAPRPRFARRAAKTGLRRRRAGVSSGMDLPTPLFKAVLLRRYKRFLADIELEDGAVATAHVANPGSMLGLSDPGAVIWVSRNDDPKRKLRYTWELVELGEDRLSGVSTAHPNRIVEEALRARRVPELAAYGGVRREVKYGQASRVDFLLTEPGLPDAYVEVKNVHLRREEDWAEFPDAVTTRGAKHLEELGNMVAVGARAVMLYLIQRDDCARFKLATDIDAAYVAAYARARARGVEAIAYACRFTRPGPATAAITLDRSLPIAEHAASEAEPRTRGRTAGKGTARRRGA